MSERPTYPAASTIFHEPALFERETAEVFRSSWVFVGTVDQLPDARSWFVYEAAGRSVIVARDKGDQLGAFVNACAHRGTRLCEGSGQGRLQCPYHGWVFDTDGSLMGPSRRKGLPQAFRNEDHGLTPLSLEQVGSFLFVAESPTQPLREALGAQVAFLERVSEDLVSEIFEIRMEIAANWKLVVSGAIEDYHVPFVHGQSLDPSRQSAAENTLSSPGHSSFAIPAPIPFGLATLMRIFTKGKEPRRSLENTLVFPNLLLVQIWTMTHVTAFVPLGPHRTLRYSRLFDMAPKRPWWTPLGFLYRVLRPLGYRGVFKVYEEDRLIVEKAQRGTAGAKTLVRPPAHAEEVRVEHFLKETAARLGYDYASEIEPAESEPVESEPPPTGEPVEPERA